MLPWYKKFFKLPYWAKSRDYVRLQSSDLLYNYTTSIILPTSTFPSDLEMPDTGTPPVIPIQFQQYKYVRKFARGLNESLNLLLSSYLVDPQWQRKFTIIWPTVLGFFVLLSLPHLIRSIRNGQAYSTLFGILEDYTGRDYSALVQPMRETERKRTSVLCRIEKVIEKFGSLFYWTLPGLGLNAGQRP